MTRDVTRSYAHRHRVSKWVDNATSAWKFGKALRARYNDLKRKPPATVHAPETSAGHYKRRKFNSKPRGGKTVKSDSGAALYRAGVKRVNAKKTKVKSKRSPKVTKLFKEKVQKSMLGQQMTAYCKDTFLGGYMYLVDDNGQSTFDGDGIRLDSTGGSCVTPWSFTLLQFRQAANRLFTSFAPVNTAASLTGNGTATQPVFPVTNLKFKILRSSSKYTWRNITQHKYMLRIFELAPKKTGVYNPASTASFQGISNTLATVADSEAMLTGLQQWVNSLANDTAQGYELNRSGPIGSSPTVRDLHRLPSSSKSFNKWFTISVDEVALEPGQTYEKFIKGPCNLELDFQKMFKNGILQDIQKFSRTIMTTVFAPLNSATITSGVVAGFGRIAPDGRTIPEHNQGFAIGVERIDQYQIVMPEETLGIISMAALGSQDNIATRRHPTRQENLFFAGTTLIAADSEVDITEAGAIPTST